MKQFVSVEAKFDTDGNLLPLIIFWEDGRKFEIDKITDVRFAPSLKAGGVGHIVNGQCLFGRKNMAGEVQFMPMNLSEYPHNLDGMLQFVAHYCLFITTMVAPEAIVVCCPYILNKDDVINAMSTYLPTEFIPDIILVDDLSEYMLTGLHQLCTQKGN